MAVYTSYVVHAGHPLPSVVCMCMLGGEREGAEKGGKRAITL